MDLEMFRHVQHISNLTVKLVNVAVAAQLYSKAAGLHYH
jgi:hypothetical protein